MTTTGGRPPLHRDVRVVQWALQIAVVAATLAVLLWLYGNYTDNVERQNIPTSFDFLDNPANFKITGSDLSQSAPVREAIVVGLQNTLRVSVAGVILATVLGTIVGVARLSHNWLVRKVAAVYVEAIRNIPLALLMTVAFLAIVLGVFPNINDAWQPLGGAVISNRGISLPWFIGSSLGLVVVILLGCVAAWIVARWRNRVSARTGAAARSATWGLAAFVLVAVAGWLLGGYDWTVPDLDGRITTGGIRVDPSYFVVLFALVIYTSSHIAEIVRGSVQAVPLGQGEAAEALALSGMQRLRFVILPQAFRIAIPPIGNQYLNLIKNSSLGAAFGYYDLTLVTQTSVGNGSPAVPSYMLTMAIYIGIALITSLLVNLANRRLALKER
jgi:general L-amino acid transport system permease protein